MTPYAYYNWLLYDSVILLRGKVWVDHITFLPKKPPRDNLPLPLHLHRPTQLQLECAKPVQNLLGERTTVNLEWLPVTLHP